MPTKAEKYRNDLKANGFLDFIALTSEKDSDERLAHIGPSGELVICQNRMTQKEALRLRDWIAENFETEVEA